MIWPAGWLQSTSGAARACRKSLFTLACSTASTFERQTAHWPSKQEPSFGKLLAELHGHWRQMTFDFACSTASINLWITQVFTHSGDAYR